MKTPLGGAVHSILQEVERIVRKEMRKFELKYGRKADLAASSLNELAPGGTGVGVGITGELSLDELADVNAADPQDGQALKYVAGSDEWQAGTLGILGGGTGQTTANAALNALLPDQTGKAGMFLRSDGTDTSWVSLLELMSLNDLLDVNAPDPQDGQYLQYVAASTEWQAQS